MHSPIMTIKRPHENNDDISANIFLPKLMRFLRKKGVNLVRVILLVKGSSMVRAFASPTKVAFVDFWRLHNMRVYFAVVSLLL